MFWHVHVLYIFCTVHAFQTWAHLGAVITTPLTERHYSAISNAINLASIFDFRAHQTVLAGF